MVKSQTKLTSLLAIKFRRLPFVDCLCLRISLRSRAISSELKRSTLRMSGWKSQIIGETDVYLSRYWAHHWYRTPVSSRVCYVCQLWPNPTPIVCTADWIDSISAVEERKQSALDGQVWLRAVIRCSDNLIGVGIGFGFGYQSVLMGSDRLRTTQTLCSDKRKQNNMRWFGHRLQTWLRFVFMERTQRMHYICNQSFIRLSNNLFFMNTIIAK